MGIFIYGATEAVGERLFLWSAPTNARSSEWPPQLLQMVSTREQDCSSLASCSDRSRRVFTSLPCNIARTGSLCGTPSS
jgi:hypothetical protein